MQIISDKILARIRGGGRGRAYTTKDFLDLANYEAVKKTLSRLSDAGTLRRPVRGVYEYPAYSRVRRGPASVDPDAVARAIARSHGWRLVPTGESALNLLGVSTQVPARWEYVTDGPSREYAWEGGGFRFAHRSLGKMEGLSPKTILVVQALRALGKNRVVEEAIRRIHDRLTPDERERAVRESRYQAVWIRAAIKQIATGADHA